MSSESTLILKGGRIWDATGAAPIDEGRLAIAGQRISSVSSADDPIDQVAQTAQTIDVTGYTVMPGIIDVHGHISLYSSTDYPTRLHEKFAAFSRSLEYRMLHAAKRMRNNLRAGVTTIRDMAGMSTIAMAALRDGVNDRMIEGSRLVVAGVTTTTNSHLHPVMDYGRRGAGPYLADGPWEMRKLARQHFYDGADLLKVDVSGGVGTGRPWNERMDRRLITREELDAIIDEGRAYGRPVACHAYTTESARMAVEAGTSSLEHSVDLDDDIIAGMVEQGIALVPTLLLHSEANIERVGRMGAPPWAAEKIRKVQPGCYESFQAAHAAGVKIACGTDIAYESGDGRTPEELELYVTLGMTPEEALTSATRTAAEVLQRSHDLGTLEAGKLADVIVVKGNPLEDITVLQNPEENILLVIQDGEIVVDRRPR